LAVEILRDQSHGLFDWKKGHLLKLVCSPQGIIDKTRCTALQYAASHGYIQATLYFLYHGVDIDAESGTVKVRDVRKDTGVAGWRALDVKKGTVEVRFVRHAINLVSGVTALHLAAIYGHILIILILLDHDADIQAKDSCQKDALQYFPGPCKGYLPGTTFPLGVPERLVSLRVMGQWRSLPPLVEIEEAYIYYGQNPRFSIDHTTQSLLQYTIDNRSEPKAMWCLATFIITGVRTDEVEAALNYAIESKISLDVIDMLLSMPRRQDGGFLVTHPNFTPLPENLDYSSQDNQGIVSLLLRHGDPAYLINGDGNTALQLARLFGDDGAANAMQEFIDEEVVKAARRHAEALELQRRQYVEAEYNRRESDILSMCE
jgi:ankyrin repeat protein